MTRSTLLRGAAWAAFCLLGACGASQGDWRDEFGRPTPNPVVLTPAQPLAIPATAELPPPGGANAATPGR